MAEESLGVATIFLTVDTTSMEANINRAKLKLAGMGPEAQKQYEAMSSSGRKYAESLARQIELTGKSATERQIYNAQLRIGGALGGELAAKARAAGEALKASAGGAQAAAHAVEQFGLNNSFARRELGRLVTDMAKGNYGRFEQTSLTLANATGLLGKVFTVTGAAIAGTAVAAGALLVAWRDGVNEINAYNKALINTGDYAGLTAKQLDDMAASMDTVRGTQHAAAAAIAQTVQAGVFTADQIQYVASASETAGKDADKMVQAFAKLAGDPVDAIVELNQQQHFLTAATYEQIKALQDQGREQDAATLAIETYADTVINRSDDVKEHLDNVSQAWGGVKSAASEAWDAMIHGTRDSANEAIQGIKDLWSGLHSAADFIQHPQQSAMQAVYGGGTATVSPNNDERDAAKKAAAQQANEVLIAFQQQTGKFKTAEEKRVAEIVKIIGEANDAIDKANAAGDKGLAAKIARQEEALIAAIQNQGKEAGQSSGGGGHTSARASSFDFDRYREKSLDEIHKEIEAEGKLMDERTRSAAAVKAYQNSLDDMLKTRQAQIDLQVKSVGMGQLEIQQTQALIAIDEDYNRKADALRKQQQNSTSAIDKAAYQQQLDALQEYHDHRVQKEIAGWAAESAAQANGLNGMKAALQDFLDEQHDVAGQMKQFTTNFIDGFGNAFASFASGAESAKTAFGSFIDDLEQQALRFLANQAIQKFLEYIGHTGPSGLNAGYFGQFNEGAAENTATGIISALGYAKGGAFGPSGEITAFARGGIVDRPTMFAFARGAGLMGEAGPEAIMPLTRLPGGDLGVKMQGSQAAPSSGKIVYNNTTINVQPTSTRRTADQIAEANARRQRIAAARNG